MADGISITDLEQKAEVTDNDNFAVDSGAITNKVTAKQIKEYMAPTYVKKAGDTMTGPLHVPTPSSDTRDTSVPTTGWVQNKMDGKAATDLSNGTKATQESINNIMPNTMDYVVESYSDANGNWWRKYKSGWIEQGGGPVSYGSGWSQRGTVNLLKEMANQKYMVTLTFATLTTFAPSLACTRRNVTSFSWQKDADDESSRSGNFVWMVIGQGA